MKKYILPFIISCLISSSAWAACTNPIPAKDKNSATVNIEAQTGPGGNCVPETVLVQGGALVAAANGLYVQPGTSTHWTVDAGTGWGLAIAATTAGSLQSLVGGAVTTAVPTYTTAQIDPLSLQTDGSLRVAPTPTAVPSAGITPSMSTAVESGHVICSGACNLYELFVTTDANAEWVEIFDATAVPADGAITPGANSLVIPPIAIAASSSVSLAALVPHAYANGLSVACSSTGGLTKTASVHCLFGWQKK